MSGRRKNIVILGSTGSIGESAVDVALRLRDKLRVVGLAAGTNAARLAEQASLLGCSDLAIADETTSTELAAALPSGTTVRAGMNGVVELATADAVDIVLCAIVGADSLRPVLEALRAGKDVALASKEALVMAGSLVMEEARRSGARILPVDSEHNAVFQCLEGRSAADVAKITLTASGGAFRDWTVESLEAATIEDALSHPTWDMGPKVTVDSATLMNKALEIVEAGWLFDMPGERIDVLIHRESVVHSLVEFTDGSILAQMGSADMRHPIKHALTYPDKLPSSLSTLNLAEISTLSFEKPDRVKYPSLDFAYEALKTGGSMPAVMNAANEVAVNSFRSGRIPFPGIWTVVESAMSGHAPFAIDSLDGVMAADAEGRKLAAGKIADFAGSK